MPALRTILIVLLMLSLACQNKPKQATKTESTAAAPDSAAALAKRPGADAPRSAADRLIRALYFEHRKQENPFQETKDRTVVDQFFAKPVADRIWVEKKSAKANLLFDAPDETIKKTWVEAAAVGGSKAIVYVTFERKNKPEEIKIDLQQTDNRWRITDMLYPSGKRLIERL